MSHGANDYIYFRPANSCGSGLANGTTPGVMPISRPAPNLLITGNTFNICSGSEDYTITGMPPGATVQWSISDNVNASLSCATCNTVTFNMLHPVSVAVLLTATVSTCAGSYSTSAVINLGRPFYLNVGYEIDGNSHPIKVWNGSSSDYNELCLYHTATTQFQFSGAQSVTWTRTYASPSSVTWNQNGNNISTYFFAGSQYERFVMTATNTCGSLVYNYGFSSKICTGGGGGNPCDIYLVSPNPASTNIQVGIHPNIPAPCDPPPIGGDPIPKIQNSTLSKSGIINSRAIQSISIYDNKGTLQQQHQYSVSNKQATLNVSNLPAGVYIVRITDGNYSENHRVVIGK